MIRNIIYGIKNLFYYFTTIWKDRDWDEYYMVRLLAVKLHKMRCNLHSEFFEDGTWIANYLRIASAIADKYVETNCCDEKLFATLFSVIQKRGEYWWD